MIGRIGPVTEVADTGSTSANAYRSPLIPSVNTNALSVQAATLELLPVVGTTVTHGAYLNAATATEPVCVLGAAAAQRLGIDRVYPGERVWVGGMWFYVGGILSSGSARARDRQLACSSASPRRTTYLGFDGHPDHDLRPHRDEPDRCRADRPRRHRQPRDPERGRRQPAVRRARRRADAQGALNGLFLGLGAVSLLVGAVGVANIMIISVLERRSEIGLRRALGATKGHIRIQFLAEAILLALLGGVVGVGAGALATAIYAHTKNWATVIPTLAWAGGIGAALAIGAVAGLPPIRAARLSPTDALRTV